jgi:hypothetical protein
VNRSALTKSCSPINTCKSGCGISAARPSCDRAGANTTPKPEPSSLSSTLQTERGSTLQKKSYTRCARMRCSKMRCCSSWYAPTDLTSKKCGSDVLFFWQANKQDVSRTHVPPSGCLLSFESEQVKGCMTASQISDGKQFTKERIDSTFANDDFPGLSLTDLRDRQWHIEACSALTGKGLHQSLDWLVARLGR